MSGDEDMDVGAVHPSLGAGASHLATAFSTARTSVLTEAATKLGISIGRLRAELEAGKPLSDIAAIAAVSVSQAHPPPAVVHDHDPDAAWDGLL